MYKWNQINVSSQRTKSNLTRKSLPNWKEQQPSCVQDWAIKTQRPNVNWRASQDQLHKKSRWLPIFSQISAVSTNLLQPLLSKDLLVKFEFSLIQHWLLAQIKSHDHRQPWFESSYLEFLKSLSWYYSWNKKKHQPGERSREPNK